MPWCRWDKSFSMRRDETYQQDHIRKPNIRLYSPAIGRNPTYSFHSWVPHDFPHNRYRHCRGLCGRKALGWMCSFWQNHCTHKLKQEREKGDSRTDHHSWHQPTFAGMCIEYTRWLPGSIVVGGMARIAVSADSVMLTFAATFVFIVPTIFRTFICMAIAMATGRWTKRKRYPWWMCFFLSLSPLPSTNREIRYGVEICSKHSMLTEHFIAERVHSNQLNANFRCCDPILAKRLSIRATDVESTSILLLEDRCASRMSPRQVSSLEYRRPLLIRAAVWDHWNLPSRWLVCRNRDISSVLNQRFVGRKHCSTGTASKSCSRGFACRWRNSPAWEIEKLIWCTWHHRFFLKDTTGSMRGERQQRQRLPRLSVRLTLLG